MTALMEEAPEDIRHIFTQNVAIPWYREPAFREVSLEKIGKCLVGDRFFFQNFGFRPKGLDSHTPFTGAPFFNWP